MIALLNIGSNLGNRRLNLSRAIAALEKEFGYFELSHTIETAPEGFESDNQFLNVGMLVHTELEPHALLRKIKEIEASVSDAPHRDASGGYIDRAIDIDLIAVDDKVLTTPELTLPHPRMAERKFVLEPLAELAPGWRHPLSGLTPAEMLARL